MRRPKGSYLKAAVPVPVIILIIDLIWLFKGSTPI
jgi:uncharacterized membrane protein